MGAALAQEYPVKPVRLVIGFPPGGANDIIARQIAPKMAESLGTQVIVDNRPGANAIIGTDFVAKAAPDGYTLGLAGLSPLLDQIATVSEQGMPALQSVNWYAIMAPAKTPRAIVERLHGVITKAALSPDLKERFLTGGFEPMTSASPEAYTAFLKQELARWGKVAKSAGIKAE